MSAPLQPASATTSYVVGSCENAVLPTKGARTKDDVLTNYKLVGMRTKQDAAFPYMRLVARAT